MEKESFNDREENEEVVAIEGRQFRKVQTGFTVRQYFSHSTPEKGPGPGWDFRRRMLEKYGVDEPSELPDDPYYRLEEI